MAYRILIFCLFILLAPAAGFAEQSDQPSESSETYGLNDCIKTALENNLGLKSRNLIVESTKLESRAALAPFDPSFSFNIFDSVTRRGGISFQSQVSGGSESKYLGSDFEISKPLFTGAKWSLKYETSRSESQSFIEEGTLKSYESKTTLSYTHPILEGADTRVNLSGVRVAEMNAVRDELQRDDLRRQLTYQVTTSFYDTLKSAKAVEVSELSLKEAQNLHETTKALFDAGSVAAYDVMVSESGLASREEAVLLAKASLLNNQDTLKNLMGIEIAKQVNFTGELDILTLEIPGFEDSLKNAVQNRQDLKSLEISKRLAEEELSLRENRVKHMLALIGSVGLQGEDTNWGSAIGDMSNLSWYLGLNYSMPLGGNKEAIARLEQARLNLASINFSIEEKIREISLEVMQALRNIDTAKQRVEVTLKGVSLMEEKLEQEKARYELGLNTTGDLLDYEEDLASARLRYIEARADYLKTISYLEFVMVQKITNLN